MRKNDFAEFAGSLGKVCDQTQLRQALSKAFDHVTSALDLLDSVDAPADIGANLQTSADRLRQILNPESG